MRTALAAAAAAFCGLAASLPNAIFWMLLGIPVRLMYLFSARSALAAALALSLGAAAGALATLLHAALPFGQLCGGAAMLLCGLATGMIAAALSEMAELLPSLVWRLRLRRGTSALVFSFAAGKMLGAFLASASGGIP